jgi:hypothetical protein
MPIVCSHSTAVACSPKNACARRAPSRSADVMLAKCRQDRTRPDDRHRECRHAGQIPIYVVALLGQAVIFGSIWGVTGIPPTEAQSLRSKGAKYRAGE